MPSFGPKNLKTRFSPKNHPHQFYVAVTSREKKKKKKKKKKSRANFKLDDAVTSSRKSEFFHEQFRRKILSKRIKGHTDNQSNGWRIFHETFNLWVHKRLKGILAAYKLFKFTSLYIFSYPLPNVEIWHYTPGHLRECSGEEWFLKLSNAVFTVTNKVKQWTENNLETPCKSFSN